MYVCRFQSQIQTYREDLVCKWVLHDDNLRRQRVLEEF